MEEILLDVEKRVKVGTQKNKSLRRDGYIPAIVYGVKDKEPTPIRLEERGFMKVLRAHRDQNMVFQLNLKDNDKEVDQFKAIIKDEQFHPVTDKLIHVDFLQVTLDQEVHVDVVITTVGEAPGVAKEGGILNKEADSLAVICKAVNIPEHIEIDISAMNVGDHVDVKNLKLPAGVKTNEDPDKHLVSIIAPKAESTETAEVDADAEPEVTKEKGEAKEGDDKAKADKKEE